MTANFANFEALEVVGKTAEYVLHELKEMPKPVLIVKPTGVENAAFFNELLREFGSDQRALKNMNPDAGMVEKSRAVTRKLFPLYVVVGWRGLRDAHGEEVPYSKDECVGLFQKLPGHMVDGIRGFCDDPMNFVRANAAPPLDAGSLAGN